MIKRLGNFIKKKRFSLFGSLLLVVFSLSSFWHSLNTGDYMVLGDSEAFAWPFRIVRICLYVALGCWIYFKAVGAQKAFFTKLLVFSILLYEFVVVFDLLGYLTQRFGG